MNHIRFIRLKNFPDRLLGVWKILKIRLLDALHRRREMANFAYSRKILSSLYLSKAILLRKGSFSVSDKGHSDADRCIGIELCKLCNQSVAQLIVGVETQKPVILALLWQIFAADERDGIPKSVFQ